jgi:hypothetical protein
MYMGVKGIYFASVSMVFQMDFDVLLLFFHFTDEGGWSSGRCLVHMSISATVNSKYKNENKKRNENEKQ